MTRNIALFVVTCCAVCTVFAAPPAGAADARPTSYVYHGSSRPLALDAGRIAVRLRRAGADAASIATSPARP